jgi:hypothetical protein
MCDVTIRSFAHRFRARSRYAVVFILFPPNEEAFE